MGGGRGSARGNKRSREQQIDRNELGLHGLDPISLRESQLSYSQDTVYQSEHVR